MEDVSANSYRLVSNRSYDKLCNYYTPVFNISYALYSRIGDTKLNFFLKFSHGHKHAAELEALLIPNLYLSSVRYYE